MKVISVLSKVPNKIGVEYPPVYGKDKNEEKVEVFGKRVIIYLASGYDYATKLGHNPDNLKGQLPNHLKGKKLDGSVYLCDVDFNGVLTKTELHESQIPSELLKSKNK